MEKEVSSINAAEKLKAVSNESNGISISYQAENLTQNGLNNWILDWNP